MKEQKKFILRNAKKKFLKLVEGLSTKQIAEKLFLAEEQ